MVTANPNLYLNISLGEAIILLILAKLEEKRHAATLELLLILFCCTVWRGGCKQMGFENIVSFRNAAIYSMRKNKNYKK